MSQEDIGSLSLLNFEENPEEQPLAVAGKSFNELLEDQMFTDLNANESRSFSSTTSLNKVISFQVLACI